MVARGKLAILLPVWVAGTAFWGSGESALAQQAPIDLDDVGELRQHPPPLSPPKPGKIEPAGETTRGNAVIRVNQARNVGGVAEIGPPLSVASGPFRGKGLIGNREQVQQIFAVIDALPIVDQVRLSWNRFAGVLLNHDLNGDGNPEKFFLTIDFPTGKRYLRDRVNPLTGVEETLVYQKGRWRGTFDDRRILEIDINTDLLETGSRIYVNKGTRENPDKGENAKPIEETKTLEVWHRDWAAEDADPTQPVIAKLRVNYVTGEATRETFAMFPRPIESVDARFITRFRYNEHGILRSAEVFENGLDDADFARPLVSLLTTPVDGAKRYELVVDLEV